MVSHVNCGNAHTKDEREEYPEQPPSVPPRSPQGRNRSRYMLRGKRRPLHSSAPFDQVDERRERSAREVAVPHARKREPRALHGEKHRDQISGGGANGAIRQHTRRPFPVTPAVANPAKNEQKNKVSK